MKIAVIDDEEEYREIIIGSLLRDGHEVVEASNGKLAYELIQNSSPDLIICDVRMPEMSGDELFDKLRHSSSELKFIPFIFLSGDVTDQEIISKLNRGADNCLRKPIDLELLSAYVNSHTSSVTRITSYLQDKLVTLLDDLPDTSNQGFGQYASIFTSMRNYIAEVGRYAQQFGTTKESRPKLSRLYYVSFCLDEYESRKQIVKTTNGEDLSWQLIFSVAKIQLQGEKIPVSDLYISAPSAKSTINARINSLIEDNVFEKVADSYDGRRQLVVLTHKFSEAFLTHVDRCIEWLKKS